MISHSSPDTGVTRRLIDAQGCEVKTVLATGAVTTREFDELRRPTRLWRNGHGAPDVTWTYLLPGDPAPPDGERYRTGRLWRVTDPLGTLTLAYDAAGRAVHKARQTPQLGWQAVTDAEYDPSGRLTAAVLPAATAGGHRRRVEYTHDRAGRPVAATDVIDNVTFDDYGRTRQIFHANGVVTALRYDPVTGQVTGQTVTGPHGEVLRDQTYQYDDEHRLIGIGVGARTGETGWRYTFDGLGRLGSATASPGAPAAYAYSDGGNMLTGPVGDSQVYVPGTSRLASVAGQPYGYDDAGRLTAAPWGQLTWDADDNLLSASTAQGTLTHAYDHTGSRVVSRHDGSIYYLRAGDDLVVTRTSTSVLIRFAGAVAATADEHGRLSWLHPDVLGNVTLMTDRAGAVTVRLTLGPWGNVISGSEPTGAGFLGNAADPSGLVCLGQRWYDPRTGRFLSPDPLVGGLYTVGAWNGYAYALNNPVLLSDPTGLTSVWAIIGLAIVVALVVVLAVATCGAALAGVTVLGVTFAAEGVSAGTLVAVGIGAFGGALAGAMSADKAGGDVMLGALVGGIIGGACALIGGALGAAVVKGMAGAATWASFAVGGAVQGAIGGFGSGFASGFAGGKGSLGDMMLAATRGMIWGATIGLVVGGVLGGKFANANPDEHNYLEFGTFHKYGLGFGANTTDMPSSYDVFDGSTGTAWDGGLAVKHALDGTFSPAGDVLGNFVDVSNVPRDVGPVGADLGFFTTDIPGTLFAVDGNAIAWAFANNGLGAGLASASVGADVAGFSYADQVILGLKGVSHMIGNLISVLDDFGVFKDVKRDFNVFYGSSSPDS